MFFSNSHPLFADFKATTPAANSTSVPAEEDEYEDEEDFEIVLDSSKATEINK